MHNFYGHDAEEIGIVIFTLITNITSTVYVKTLFSIPYSGIPAACMPQF